MASFAALDAPIYSASVKIALPHLCISYVIVFPMSLWVNIDMLWWRRGMGADGARRAGTAADRTARRVSLRLRDATTEVSLRSVTQHQWNSCIVFLLCTVMSFSPSGGYICSGLSVRRRDMLVVFNQSQVLSSISISPVSNLLVSKRLPLPQCVHNYRL